MKYFLEILIIAGALHSINGLKCYVCSVSTFDGLDSGDSTQRCYIPTSSTTSSTCPTPATNMVAYCSAEFTIQDGIVVAVSRECKEAASVPSVSEYCEGNIQSGVSTINNPIDATTCKYTCSASDNCNSQATTSLSVCSTNCTNPTAGGYCDYIQGSCVCNSGYSGTDCSTVATTTTTTFNCVQCNSEIDSSCNTTTTATACESGSYCYSAQTWLFDESNTIQKNIITRGCTSQYVAVDECSFSDNADTSNFGVNEYFEYTCISTCNTAGCNTNYPDGTVNGNEKKTLQCVQCTFDRNSATADSCSTATARTPCSDTSATHCSSSVTYWISERSDLNHDESMPDYELAKVERTCATAAVTTQCTTSPVLHMHFNQTVCQESCVTDGCNVGWPARPTCFMCSTDHASDNLDGYDTCRESPSVAVACTYPYQAYCGIQEQRRDYSKTSGHFYQITRGCYYKDIGNACNTSTINGYDYRVCNKTCTDNFCNQGSGAKSVVASIIVALLPAFVLQKYWS